MGTSDHLSGRGTAGSMDMISRSSSFCSLLVFEDNVVIFVTSEDNVDGFRGILELCVVRFVPLVVLFGLFIH
jgi:hypothetical protein